MADAHEVLSLAINTDNRAGLAGLREFDTAMMGSIGRAKSGLRELGSEWTGLGKQKPFQFVKAEQTLQLAQTEAQMAKLARTTHAAGAATKLQAAELDVLTHRHAALRRELEKTVTTHSLATRAATAASYGILGAGAMVIAGSIKQSLAWEKLGKTIEQQTGLSGKALDRLMGDINQTSGTVPYKLEDIADAAVLLKTRFGESDPQIAKTSGLMVAFAKRAGEEVTPAVRGLANILRDYREPLSHVVGLTDQLTSVSQLTQQPLGAMESTIERFGPKLQAMGYGLSESVRLMGIMGESGIKSDQMGRGLSAAYGNAQKLLGGAEGPQAALQKQGEAVQKAREHIAALGLTIPKTAAEQARLAIETHGANDTLTAATKKYEALKKVILEAGGAHATVGGLVRAEIGQVEHAKSSQEAYSIAATDFGRMVGPMFARAFYNNKEAIAKTDKAMKEHSATAKLLKAEEETFEGQLVKLNETWHQTERTLGKDLIPVLKTFLGLIQGGVGDIEKFAKGNAGLSEMLGAAAMVASGAFLARKPLGALAHGASSVFSKVTGIGGSDGGGSIHGVTGTAAMAGSKLNPIATWNVNGGPGGGGGPIPGASAGEKAAGEDVKLTLERFAEKHPYLFASGTVVLAAGAAVGIGVAVDEGFKHGIEALSPGYLKPHNLGEVTKNLAGGPGRGLRVEHGELKPVGGGGHPRLAEAGVVGGYEGKLHPIGHETAQEAKRARDAYHEMMKAAEGYAEAQKAVQVLVEEGKKGTPEYAQAVERLAEAHEADQKVLASLVEMNSPLVSGNKQAAESFAALKGGVESTIKHLSATLAAHPSAAVRSQVLGNYNKLINGIGAEMQAGLVSVGQGTKEINQALIAEAKVLGLSPSDVSSALGKISKGAGALGSTAVGGLTSGFASGGRVPGSVGPDNWTLVDPAGRPAAKVGGAELLIANRHTEADASAATMAIYGKTLGQMVAGETTPHSQARGGRQLATGGRIHDPKWSGPGGLVGALGHAALAKTAHAANIRLDQLSSLAGPAPSGGAHGPVPPGSVRQWLTEALRITHHFSGANLSALYGRTMQESGGNPHSINLWDSNAKAGHPSKGLLQTIDSTFSSYKLPGHGDIWNPVDNSIAAIRYMFARYGHIVGPSASGYALGGRVDYAGKFGQGGAVTASKPTMAMFGENGTETAVFLPHAAEGLRVGKSGLQETEGLNPDNNQIEYHTSAEWKSIRLHHSQYAKAHPKAGEIERAVTLGATQIASIIEKGSGAIPITGDMSKIAALTWKKIVAAIEKTLKDSGGSPAFDVHTVMTLSKDAKGPRMHELLGKAISDTAKTVMTVAAGAPAGQAVGANALAVRQLTQLITAARRDGSKTLETALLKDIQTTVRNWDAAIKSQFSTRSAKINVGEQLKIARQSLALIASHGAGVGLPTSATDPAFLAAQQAAKEGEIASYKQERAKLVAAEKRAHDAHNQKLAKQIREQIAEIDTSIGEARVDVAQLQIDYKTAMYEAFKKTIAEADQVFEAHLSQISLGGTLAEGSLHRQGLDFAGLEEDKSKQEGVLTPAQIAQAKADLVAYDNQRNAEIAEDQKKKAYDESVLGGLSGEDRTNMERTIEGLNGSINDLMNQIYDQGKATEKLTEATNNNTKVYGGTVAVSFHGQDYVVGGSQSSVNASAINLY